MAEPDEQKDNPFEGLLDVIRVDPFDPLQRVHDLGPDINSQGRTVEDEETLRRSKVPPLTQRYS